LLQEAEEFSFETQYRHLPKRLSSWVYQNPFGNH